MPSLYAKIRMIFNRDERLMFTLPEFTNANKDLLIIVCDPANDRMFISYKNRSVNSKIKSPTGKNLHVIKDVLKYSRFDKTVNQFLTAIMEALQLPTWKGSVNHFYQFIDAAVFNIAKSLRKTKSPLSPNGRT